MHRATRPRSFLLAFVLGMAVGTLAPRYAAASARPAKGGRRGPLLQGPLMAQLVRAARIFAIRRLVMLLQG